MLVRARSLAPAGLEDLSVIRMLSAAPRPFLDNKRQLWPRFPQNALTGALDAVAAIG